MAELFFIFVLVAVGALVLPLIAIAFVIKLVLKTIFLPAAILLGIVKLILLVTLIPVAIGFGIALLAALAVFAIPFVIVGAFFVGAAHLLL